MPLSESGNKVVTRDDGIAASIGLKVEADKNLPDLILADLGPADPPIVFVEVVATDAPISQRRQDALYVLTDAIASIHAFATLPPSGCMYLTSALPPKN